MKASEMFKLATEAATRAQKNRKPDPRTQDKFQLKVKKSADVLFLKFEKEIPRQAEKGGFSCSKKFAKINPVQRATVEEVKTRLEKLGFTVDVRKEHKAEKCFEQGMGYYEIPSEDWVMEITWYRK